ncbi:uncharacterized protein LOC124438212 isoform X2 [Xenia sp. Carnegie-2017]|uniref:uncharacterized protein LOC124438212 isoform X2 n=1 Tax=Xenia sp. Carnegie-2017 TaxID=2897299 RepID=UPI001F040B8D|nr:uncharacterized protein LOC124438212 isoform X2 [Xenia sp. Carnegie-2017]
MLAGIIKLINSDDIRLAGNASYIVGTIAETPLGCDRIVRLCTASSDEDSCQLLNSINSLMDVSIRDLEIVLNAAGALSTLAESDDGRMWLLRQDALNETIDRLSTLLSNEDRWIASNAALVLARLTIAEEGCARILNHPHSNSTLKQLIRSLNVDGDGVERNTAFAIGRLCDLQTGRVRLLSHSDSNLMLESLLKMLHSKDLACQKNASFAVSCISMNILGLSRILKSDSNMYLFSAMIFMLSTTDEEAIWFAAMTIRVIACQKQGVLALRKYSRVLSSLQEIYKRGDTREDTLIEIRTALELLEKLPKADKPHVEVQSAYVISVKWEKIFPKSGLEVSYQLHRDGEIIYFGDENSFVMTNASPMSNYTFQLRYTTEGDESALSDCVTVKTPESVPSSPQCLVCLNRTTSQLKVAWQPPELTNGILLCYHVTVNGPKVSLAPYQETKETSFILSGLLPGNEYKFEVHAVTAQGRGEPAILLLQTVDLAHHAPCKPTLSVLGRREILVEWEIPNEPLNRITSYEVKVNGESVYVGVEKCFVLRRLQPDTEYSVTVSAWTNEGRCESLPSKRRTNKEITITSRPPLYPFQKKTNDKSK